MHEPADVSLWQPVALKGADGLARFHGRGLLPCAGLLTRCGRLVDGTSRLRVETLLNDDVE
jgi:hypothetical protein